MRMIPVSIQTPPYKYKHTPRRKSALCGPVYGPSIVPLTKALGSLIFEDSVHFSALFGDPRTLSRTRTVHDGPHNRIQLKIFRWHQAGIDCTPECQNVQMFFSESPLMGTCLVKASSNSSSVRGSLASTYRTSFLNSSGTRN